MYEITSAALFISAWLINKYWKKLWWLALLLAALGSLALAVSTVGGWLANILSVAATMLAGAVNGLFGSGISGAMVLGLGALIGTIVIVADILVDRKCNKAAIIAFTVTPLAAMYAGGIIGELHGSLRDAGSGAATGLVSALIGG